MPNAEDLKLLSLQAPSTAAGFSGETRIAALQWRESESLKSQKFVVRSEVHAANAPESNFKKMVSLQKVLGQIPGLAVPKVHWSESDTSIIGGPFFIMDYVDGKAAPDSPPFAASGWVYDASEESRKKMYQSGVEFLTRLHALDWRELKLDFLLHEGNGSTQTHRHLDFIVDIYEKAMEGTRTQLAEQTIKWLYRHIPAAEKLSISWGDARLGNMLWKDFECVAALDWEMCTLAEPSADLAWWLFFERATTEGLGLKRLAGMFEREEMLSTYESIGKTTLENFDYHEIFAGFRALATVTYMIKAWERSGQQLFGPGSSVENNPIVNTLEIMLATKN